MRYYKILELGYVVAIGKGRKGGVEIDETEYSRILNILHDRPAAPDGYMYRLTDELEWELHEQPAEEEELTDGEALDIIIGGAE